MPLNTFFFFKVFCQKRLASFFPNRMMCHRNSYQSEESTMMMRDGEEYYERISHDYAQACQLYSYLEKQ